MLKRDRLYCFSPPVMLATFLIELSGAVWLLMRYRTNRSAQLIIALLVFLGIFQLAEYMVCEGAWGISSLDWARVGYMAISLLPPLGLHLALALSGKPNVGLLAAAYGSAVAFAGYFLFVGHGLQGQMCLGNYVIFSIAASAVHLYTLYYYGWLGATIALALYYGNKIEDRQRKKALAGLAVGYAAFIVPTVLVSVMSPVTTAGIPSIMCGFAVILALILLLWVAPRVLTRR